MAERKSSYAVAVHKAKEPFMPYEFELNPLGPHDVELRITHSGMCHSDLHTVLGEWGDQKWPVVPGHEMIGHVTAIGPEVKQFKIGQRVGVGPQAMSCLTCKFCLMGQECYCTGGFIGSYGNQLPNGYITKGGYALYNRTHEHFVFPIPDNLPSHAVAPNLCAGITVFTPLKNLKVGKGSRVGVIGVGGLGHMALQFARAMGAEVYALSSSPSKEAEARQFGASHFVHLSDEKALDGLKDHLDVLINTASVHYKYEKIFNTIAPMGTFVQLGAAEGPMSFSGSSLVMRGRSVTGSLIGPPGYMREMLEVSSKHNILAAVEVVPWEQVNQAVRKVLDNKVRYRMVLEMPKEDKPAQM